MPEEAARCYRCGRPAGTEDDDGIWTIYVRRPVADRTTTVAICAACWEVEQPGRAPVRLLE